jgi:4-hydroxybenzoyl-CoA thioesterase
MSIFQRERPLRFGDCDPSGIAYYPSYFNLLNGVVEDFWSSLGFPWTELIGKRRIGTPTAHLACDFVRPSKFGDILAFELTATKLGRSSLHLSHRIGSGAELRWSANQVLVATDLETHTACAWPGDVRAGLERFMETH